MSGGTKGGAEATEGLAAFGYRQELKRSLSLVDMAVFGLLMISPTAPFAVFGSVYNLSHGMAPLVYVIGLVAMAFTALSYMTMARAFPVAGSVYAYAARGIGQGAGFLAGWALLLDYLLIPSVAYVAAAVAINAVAPDLPPPALVVAMIVGVTVTNLAGVEVAKWLSWLMIWAQIAVLAALIVLAGLGIAHGTAGAHLSVEPFWQPKVMTPQLLFGALSIAALSFLGFDAISTLAEEAKGGPRSVGQATLLCLLVAAGLFVLQTWLASLFVLGKPAFAKGEATDAAFLGIAGLIGGPWFKLASSLFGIALGCLAGALSAQAAASRLVYGMARDRRLPSWLAHINGERKTPDRATLVIAVITLAVSLSLVDQLELLFALVSFGALTGFLFLHLSVLVHYGLKKGAKPFLHIVSPILGIAVIGYVLLNADNKAKIVGLSWLAVGTVVLAWLKLSGRAAPAPAPAPAPEG